MAGRAVAGGGLTVGGVGADGVDSIPGSGEVNSCAETAIDQESQAAMASFKRGRLTLWAIWVF
jgi:hypothetical protein